MSVGVLYKESKSPEMVILSRCDYDQIICLKFPDWEPCWDPQSRSEDRSRAAGPWQRGEASVQRGPRQEGPAGAAVCYLFLRLCNRL